MRFDISVIAALAATVAADYMTTDTKCVQVWPFPAMCGSSGIFTTDFNSYPVDANDGCRRTKVPGMTEFCVDWKRKRGHFRFSHQGDRRCFKQTQNEDKMCGKFKCAFARWEERPCSEV